MLVLLPAMLFAGQKNKTKKANAETAAWRYEIQNEAVGADNTVLVRVWSYSKSVDVARKQALKNAVHGLIFKGGGGQQRPLEACPRTQAAGKRPERRTDLCRVLR